LPLKQTKNEPLEENMSAIDRRTLMKAGLGTAMLGTFALHTRLVRAAEFSFNRLRKIA